VVSIPSRQERLQVRDVRVDTGEVSGVFWRQDRHASVKQTAMFDHQCGVLVSEALEFAANEIVCHGAPYVRNS